MNREQIVSTLRAHEAELHAVGVLSLSLFGSVARSENLLDSNIQVAVRLGVPFSKPGFDYFSRLDDLQARLTEILGCQVDVVEEPVRKDRLERRIDVDRAVAF